MNRRIGICADDFGLHEAINEAGLMLAEAGRLSALSCMSTAPAWRDGAAALRRRGSARRLDLGLHMNLTEVTGPAGWRRPLGPLIVSAGLHALPQARLREEIRLQLDAFEAGLDQPPDFIDGHQHVHQLPQVRTLLIEALLQRYPARRPWLRDTAPPPGRSGGGADARKQRGIAALGARPLSKAAARLGLPQNRGFVGVYDFGGTLDQYLARLRGWCAELGEGGLLMCHPASQARPGDPIAAARLREFAVLGGPAFAALLREQGLVVSRLSALFSAA